MLLTSGQVSVAVSSTVVFLFTFALFLSGYVLQQQTLRDIRTAIKPPPTTIKGNVYSPKQFEGQRIPVPGEGNVVVNMRRDLDPASSKPARRKKGAGSQDGPETKQVVDGEKVLIAEDMPIGAGGSDGSSAGSAPASSLDDPTVEKQLSRAARRKKIREEILADGDGESFKGYRPRVVS